LTEAGEQRREVPELLEHDYVAGALPAVAASVTALRHAVVGFARKHGLAEETLDRVGLAVTEAAANAVLHAYPGSAPGPIGYVADIVGDDLQVVVSDEGRGIRASHRSDGLGLGLTLIAEHTSDFGIAPREPAGLEVWMRFLPA
jgi:anti-sigma regulatory factor (Ser/Thr protein kinase)